MTRLILFNKPYGVICQFSPDDNHPSLTEYIPIKKIYPAGRLDHDSEGLLLLTDDGKLQNKITHPKNKMPKTYWVQVDGNISDEAINQLQKGVKLKDGLTRPAKAKRIEEPQNLWARNPPVRFRKNIPTSWLELTIKEGRNRQVRRMTAATGFPTLRLIRYRIGEWSLENLKPGKYIIKK
jgi:23S rRNA pseudouridine2457 synthase